MTGSFTGLRCKEYRSRKVEFVVMWNISATIDVYVCTLRHVTLRERSLRPKGLFLATLKMLRFAQHDITNLSECQIPCNCLALPIKAAKIRARENGMKKLMLPLLFTPKKSTS